MSLRGDYLGGLPVISRIFDWNPVLVYLFAVAIDFGMVNLLMFWEGHFWRERYLTFKLNDTISIPLMVAAAAVVLQHSGKSSQVSVWWQAFVLIAAFVVSIFLVRDAMNHGVYTRGQVISPSAMYHTFIFGLMGYWMFSPLPAIIRYHKPGWAVAAYVVGLILFGLIVAHDTQPKDPHLEAHYEFPDIWNSTFTVRR